MAFEANEFGRSVAAPGLVFADQPYTNESHVMGKVTVSGTEYGADVSAEGGFAVFAKPGEDVKVFSVAPGDSGYFLGIAQRVVNRDSYPIGTPVNVITKGRVWVKVYEAVESGTVVGLGSSGFGKPHATTAANTDLSNATYRTSAAANGYAVVELK